MSERIELLRNAPNLVSAGFRSGLLSMKTPEQLREINARLAAEERAKNLNKTTVNTFTA
jgi:hypothetical protein